ncbi:MAG: NADPH-dependent assimilatory sulfite reductase hemoprotein subunit [Pseudomonadota bacterium]|nr:NADPH-dependent assimilatory sulfite reductase hemoprotein subunit [Pseudomonadota bacterium]MDE3037752.1 NADPH-dependent assimilatory sulfite reductase hemoprotein subunit [Pseudomonadota bacterium]
MSDIKLSKQETTKRESCYLKGGIAGEMADLSTPKVSDAAYELLKFHGSYFGYDRDSATERKQRGLDKEYEFMVRMKCPGGRLTAAQYIALDCLSDKYANGSMRITTRETLQFHCIKKVDMKPLIRDINLLLLSTLGGCGDITRNIITCPAPIKDGEHAKLEADAFLLAKHCAPKTTSYYEVWLDGEVVADYPFRPEPATGVNPEPLYGETYMPRKFKIAVGAPDDNCMDALCNDLAILSLFENHGKHLGYNFALGGGLGMNHNQPKTYPYLAKPVMYVSPDMLIPATEAVIKLQRDHGDRIERKHARLKYIVAEKGVQWIKETLERYIGRAMEDPRPQAAYAVVDHTGWNDQLDDKWFLGVPIPSGRIVDRDHEAIRSGLREVILEYGMDLRLTADQNILLCDIETSEKGAVEQILHKYGITLKEDMTPMEKNFIACVALPTCGKALAEAERIAHPLIGEIDAVMRRHGVQDENIAIRLAGCPNGCPRPYVGDIGIVGRTPETYALYIGGDFEGTRLNEKIFDKVPFSAIADALDPMFALWKEKRNAGEAFGNFCQRYGIAAVKQAVMDALEMDWAK